MNEKGSMTEGRGVSLLAGLSQMNSWSHRWAASLNPCEQEMGLKEAESFVFAFVFLTILTF